MTSGSEGRSVLRQHPERAAPQAAVEILAQGLVAQVGFAVQGQPFVIPFSYHFDPQAPDRLFLHGSPAGRALRHLSGGAPVCVTVTLLNGLVYSRTALNHSMNYRGVVAFGTARQVSSDSDKARILEQMIRRYFPGRTAARDYAAPTAAQLSATALLEVRIEEMSAKVRAGGPTGPLDQELDAAGTCGVIELSAPVLDVPSNGT